jgi:deoxycytidylate deaminase
MTIIGTGYNGYLSGMDDESLPDKGEAKYPYMRHSETNAIANCNRKPNKCIAYVTGYPCNNCLFSLYENGINAVVFANLWIPKNNTFVTPELAECRSKFLEQVGDSFLIGELKDEIVLGAINLLEERATHFKNKRNEVLVKNGQ